VTYLKSDQIRYVTYLKSDQIRYVTHLKFNQIRYVTRSQRQMPSNPSKWKRLYMESEHARRQDERKIMELSKLASEQHEAIAMLESEVRRGRNEIRCKHRTILSMRATLVANNLPVQYSIESMHVCTAIDDLEECPLSMAPINDSPPPLERCKLAALDPLHPDFRCAELICGHRFNAVWLMCHFVRNRTFQCPVCRSGKRIFNFDRGVIPAGIIEALQ